MKTPREILFERNRTAEPKLDALRKSFVSEQIVPIEPAVSVSRAPAGVARARRAITRANIPTLASFLQKIIQELFLPYRRAWIGLAAVWAVILGVNLIAYEGTTQSALAKITTPTPEVLTLLKEQKQMMAQLLGPAVRPPKPPDARAPRTQWREEFYSV